MITSTISITFSFTIKPLPKQDKAEIGEKKVIITFTITIRVLLLLLVLHYMIIISIIIVYYPYC